MLELPEAAVIAKQITKTLRGKRIAQAVANATPHKFAWFTGDPAQYNAKLAGKVIGDARAVGGYVEFGAGDMVVAVGAAMRYHGAGEARPKRHQLLLEFEDGAAFSGACQLWGGFFCFPPDAKKVWFERDAALAKPSPLTDAFDRAYFDTLFDAETPKLSAKAFLATEQRIPGLGNGVLQDILWTARVHPRRKMGDLAPAEVEGMYQAVKSVLAAMAAQGGRDTELDLHGRPGGYATILSKNTVDTPCPACGSLIRKESFQGGAIYYCPTCQPL